MERILVQSSNLSAVAYDDQTYHLDVEFKSGSQYRYYNVTPEVYEGLTTAPSKGVYFNNIIKPKFHFVNLTGQNGTGVIQTSEAKMSKLYVGKVVHYVAYGTPNREYQQGAHRAAVIAEVKNQEQELCIVAVFNPTGIHWNTAPHDESGKQPGTWHYIEEE